MIISILDEPADYFLYLLIHCLVWKKAKTKRFTHDILPTSEELHRHVENDLKKQQSLKFKAMKCFYNRN